MHKVQLYFILVLSLLLNGCVKSIETSGGTKINFITGWDLHAGMNGVDRVEDQRGIKPTEKN